MCENSVGMFVFKQVNIDQMNDIVIIVFIKWLLITELYNNLIES
jgi:hypothetical protein